MTIENNTPLPATADATLKTTHTNRALSVIIAAIAIIGLIDAGFLTYKHYAAAAIPLTCSTAFACNEVTTSSYSIFWGLPVSIYGMLFYIATIALLILSRRWRAAIYWLVFFSAVGFLFSLRFVYIQFFVLQATCPYCLLSAAISLVIFILSFRLLLKK